MCIVCLFLLVERPFFSPDMGRELGRSGMTTRMERGVTSEKDSNIDTCEGQQGEEGEGRVGEERGGEDVLNIPCTIYYTLYTLHSTLYTLHSTLHSTLYTLHSTLYTSIPCRKR